MNKVRIVASLVLSAAATALAAVEVMAARTRRASAAQAFEFGRRYERLYPPLHAVPRDR